MQTPSTPGWPPRPAGEARVGLEPPRLRVPVALARAAGAVVERAWEHFHREDDPPITRFLAEQLSTAHWFDQRETRQALGWEPEVSLDEGFRRLESWFRSGARAVGPALHDVSLSVDDQETRRARHRIRRFKKTPPEAGQDDRGVIASGSTIPWRSSPPPSGMNAPTKFSSAANRQPLSAATRGWRSSHRPSESAGARSMLVRGTGRSRLAIASSTSLASLGRRPSARGWRGCTTTSSPSTSRGGSEAVATGVVTASSSSC